MNVIGYGIDCSHHQDPATLPWETFRGKVDFVIVRACYGARLDKRSKEHIMRAREIGAKVGLYGFFRPGQPWMDQSIALERTAESCGITTDDIVPSLDIERDPFSTPPEVTPAWEDGCRRIIERWCELYGNAMVYITQREFGFLGKPEWVLHRPLWCANFRVEKPASPAGMPPTIWQHRVDVFDPTGPSTSPDPPPSGTIDQNRLLLPLPLVGYRPTEDDQARVLALVAENLRRAVQESDTDPAELDPAVETPRLA